MSRIFVFDKCQIIFLGLKATINELIFTEFFSINSLEELMFSNLNETDILFIENNQKGKLNKELILKIRNNYPNLRIIVFTDYTNESEVCYKLKEIPFCRFLSKSANKEDILISFIDSLKCSLN